MEMELDKNPHMPIIDIDGLIEKAPGTSDEAYQTQVENHYKAV